MDAVVVGSGPNGLAAAVVLARAGLSVKVVEGAATPGGGCRTQALTLDGYRHDVCSAVHPLVAASPFFATMGDLSARGAALRTSRVAFAHPLDGGRAGAVWGTVDDTAAGLSSDGAPYRRLLAPLVRDAAAIVDATTAPIRSLPPRPLAAARFALAGVLSARRLAQRFSSDEARSIVAGAAAHAIRPLTAPATAGYALVLMMLAHSVGWPVIEGGTGRLVDALVAELESLGARVTTGRQVRSLDDVGPCKVVLLDVGADQLVSLAGGRLPAWRRRAIARVAHGPGVCKVDWALSGPVPWSAPACREAVTLHVGGTFEAVAAAEAEVAAGRHPERPFCIVVQPGIVDSTRAPVGAQTLWAYCHVPSGSTIDMTARIEAQIERFAPGFCDLVLARATRTAADVAAYNPNFVGGDINGGAATLWQTLFRPFPAWNPYRTGIDGVYLCSASTPPGGGVHGMCGMWAARTALADLGLK